MLLKHLNMFKRSHFYFSNLLSKQESLFKCSEIILKSILQYDTTQPIRLVDVMMKSIQEDKSIINPVKAEIKNMFNPLLGIRLQKQFLIKSNRFEDALNQQRLYPMDANPKLLKMIAKPIFRKDKNNQIVLDLAKPMLYYIGTPGLAKSCSFFNFSYILNLRVPFLISNQNFQPFLIKGKCKFLYFISTYNRQQIVEYILYQLEKDFGSQFSNNLRVTGLDWNENQLDFGNYIARLVQPYKKLKISIYVTIDQFNQLYLKENKSDNNVLWWNWREIAQMAAAPVMLVASKNNNILQGQLDPVRIIARADQNITKVFPDKSPIKDKIKDFANSLCFEMEKNKFEKEQIIQVLKSIKSNMPLCSHLSARKLVEQAIVGSSDEKVTQMITLLKNYQEYQDYKIMEKNLKNMIKQSLQRQNQRKSSQNISIQNEKNNKLIEDNNNKKQQQIQVTKDNFTQYLNKGYIESQDQQIFRLRTFVDFYLNTQVQEIQTNFQYKSQKIELKSQVLYTSFERSILNRLQETPINYFLKDFKYYNEKKYIQIVYSMLNEQQHQKLIQSIFKNKLTQYLNSNAKKKLNDTKDGQKFEADLKSQLNCHKLNKGFAIIIFILSKFNQFSNIKQNTVSFNIEQFYKFPLINKTNNWLQHYYKKQINLNHYKKINEQNLLYKYTWDDLLGDIISVPCYFSASGSNKAFDILLTKMQDNKLHLYFVDFLCSKDSEAAKDKFNKFIVLFKQINIYVLLMGLANKQEVHKIQINYFVVNKLKQRSFSNFIQKDIKNDFQETLKFDNLILNGGSKEMKKKQFNTLKTQLQKKLDFVVSQKQVLYNNLTINSMSLIDARNNI